MHYGFRSFTFDLPAGLDDESVLSFLARDGDAVAFNLTCTRDRLGGSLEAYLGSAVEQMQQSLSGYQLGGRSNRQIAGKNSAVLEHSATSPDGATLWQLQAFVPDGDDVLIITGSSTDEALERMKGAFEALVGSLRVG